MTKIVHGIVHGKTIELDQELGVADGQRVDVAIQIVGSAPKMRLGERDFAAVPVLSRIFPASMRTWI